MECLRQPSGAGDQERRLVPQSRGLRNVVRGQGALLLRVLLLVVLVLLVPVLVPVLVLLVPLLSSGCHTQYLNNGNSPNGGI